MKLLVLGATGDVGSQVMQEAARRGHRVTAIGRRPPQTMPDGQGIDFELLDVLTDTQKLSDLASKADAIASSLRPPAGQEDALVALTRAALTVAHNSSTRIYITGGAATLRISEETEHTVLTAPDFLPAEVRPIAEACERQETLLDEFDTVGWTYIQPPAQLLQGERTGRYAFGRGTLVTGQDGASQISYADFAVAFVDLMELEPAIGQKMTVGW